jgi:type II secretory pathway pseudopilin PulG
MLPSRGWYNKGLCSPLNLLLVGGAKREERIAPRHFTAQRFAHRQLAYLRFSAQAPVSRSKSGDGFTLLEGLVAAGLLAAVILVFLSIWVMVIAGEKSQRLILAHHIASKKIDVLRQTDFTSLPGSGPFSDPDLNQLPGGAAQLSISDYLETPDMKQVRVTISWLESNATRTYDLYTVIAKGATYPPQ